MANREKFWIEKKGKAAKWLPSNGFFIGRLDEARTLAAREAEAADVKYPCMVILENGERVVEIYHTDKDYSSTEAGA